MNKREIVKNLKNKNLKPFGSDLQKLAEFMDCSIDFITTECYEWGFAHVAELLVQNFPERYEEVE